MKEPATSFDAQVANNQEARVLYPPPKTDNPWLQIAGIYSDDPLFEEWQAEIEAYRRERDPEDYV